MSKSKRKAAFKLLQRGKQYPGVHGKVVDFVDHGWGEGMLFVHVRFMDKTEVCWRLAAHLTIKGADLSDWKRGEFDHARTFVSNETDPESF
jgi:hypothetical protein